MLGHPDNIEPYDNTNILFVLHRRLAHLSLRDMINPMRQSNKSYADIAKLKNSVDSKEVGGKGKSINFSVALLTNGQN